MVLKIFEGFRKKVVYPKRWIIVRLSESAKDMFVKSELCMVIEHYEEDRKIAEEPYTPIKIQRYMEAGIPVVWDESIEELEMPPTKVEFFSSWFFYRRPIKVRT